MTAGTCKRNLLFEAASGRGRERRPRAPRSGSRAFTLVEIMVVLVIITILVTLLYTVIARSRPKLDVSIARAQVKAIDMALRSYKSVYGEWPMQEHGDGDSIYTYDNMGIVSNLVGYNPKKIAFLQVGENELTETNAAGTRVWREFLADPWGNAYVICVDSDNNNRVTITNQSRRMESGSATFYRFDFTHPAPAVVFSFSGSPGDVSSLSQDGLIGSWEK